MTESEKLRLKNWNFFGSHLVGFDDIHCGLFLSARATKHCCPNKYLQHYLSYWAFHFISKLQRVQNALVGVVLQNNSATSAGLLLNSLHWLPVHSWINFKIATITYKSLYSQSPGYLASMFHHYMPTRNLRSSNIHCFFHLTQQKQITNYQLTSSLHVSYHLSKPTSKLHYFQHTSWLVSVIACLRFTCDASGLCTVYKWLLSLS